jgi:hypothetical protein
MRGIQDVHIQKLFVIALILKVGSSFLSWWFNFPWTLGFWGPLAIMTLYVVLGSKRRKIDITDEKFADSCYYLGFIFTITSIIFSLFDLPNIGFKIQDIAVRFGAAMTSTVIGLSVRVYLVSFKGDVADAITEAEEAVIDASKKLREQLFIVVEKLRDFQEMVDQAATTTIENVNVQIETLSKSHGDKLSSFFTELTNRNQDAITQMLKEINTSSFRLSQSVNVYSLGMQDNLKSIESKITDFTVAVTNQLKATTFPDDFFSKNLAAPLAQLTTSANSISAGVYRAASEVDESTTVIAKALKSLRTKATNVETSLDTIIDLTSQQQAVLDTAQGQITTLSQLSKTLEGIDTALYRTVNGFHASSAATASLTTRIEDIVKDGAETRKSLENSLNGISEKLNAGTLATEAVVSQQQAALDAAQGQISTLLRLTNTLMGIDTALNNTVNGFNVSNAVTTSLTTRIEDIVKDGAETRKSLENSLNGISEKLSAGAVAMDAVAVKLEKATTADIETAKSFRLHTTTVVGRVDQMVEQLQSVASHFSIPNTVLRTTSASANVLPISIRPLTYSDPSTNPNL